MTGYEALLTLCQQTGTSVVGSDEADTVIAVGVWPGYRQQVAVVFSLTTDGWSVGATILPRGVAQFNEEHARLLFWPRNPGLRFDPLTQPEAIEEFLRNPLVEFLKPTAMEAAQ